MLCAKEPAKLLITIFITIEHENGFKARKILLRNGKQKLETETKFGAK